MLKTWASAEGAVAPSMDFMVKVYLGKHFFQQLPAAVKKNLFYRPSARKFQVFLGSRANRTQVGFFGKRYMHYALLYYNFS